MYTRSVIGAPFWRHEQVEQMILLPRNELAGREEAQSQMMEDISSVLHGKQCETVDIIGGGQDPPKVIKRHVNGVKSEPGNEFGAILYKRREIRTGPMNLDAYTHRGDQM